VNYGYEKTVTLLVPVEVPSDFTATGTVRIEADVSWLVCEIECIPQQGRVALNLATAEPGATSGEPVAADKFEPVRATWPVSLPGEARYEAAPGNLELRISDADLSFAQADSVWFASNDWGPVAASGEQSWRADASGLTLRMPVGDIPLSDGAILDGLLVVTDSSSGERLARGFTVSASPSAPATESTPPQVTLLLAIGFAVLGGLILNLMPCVLPVLSIKALGLVQQASQDRETGSMRHSISHGMAFGIGVLLSFLALAVLLLGLRAGGAAIGWGFQLQEPAVVIGLMLLMLALGLNLSGVFSLGSSLSGVGQSFTEKRSLSGSFATGVLAVVVASPCTAPFMGTALGFALTRPPIETLLVFTGLAVGFAAPLMLLSAKPGWAKWLPKPGPWMERLRNALAFPLYATAAWLLWVLTQQVDAARLGAALAGTLLFAFGLWWLGQPLRKPGLRGSLVAVLLLGSLGFVTYASRGLAPSDGQAAAGSWSSEQVAALRADGRAVLVNFTAAWCITCKVNERVALDTDAVREALATHDIAYLKGDWTNRNAAITGELHRYGRSGVPLYLVYPAGPGEPEVLPQLLTEGRVLQALARSVSTANQGA
jgi:thiol:disulfide interchange protein DsbD